MRLPTTNVMVDGTRPLSHSCLKTGRETWHSRVMRRSHRPLHSPDVTNYDLYLWGSSNVKMFKINPRTLEELNNNIRRELSTVSG